MTSEALKTNDFLRRRKLRLQQVREQSKEIAKRIRQRAQGEKLKQFDDLDEKRRQDYLQTQDELIKKLEELYVKGVENVGASHRSAAEEKQDVLTDKRDLSKKRGKEATAELRKKKQEKLDEQKKLLDKRLQAREAANELSREKTTAASKTKNKVSEDIQSKTAPKKEDNNPENIGKLVVAHNDMATQWDFVEMPNEWEPNVPTLTLPKDDKDSVKETSNQEFKSEKSKRLNLFALSEDMPSSLRGGVTYSESMPKQSLTLVTEYLQSRAMRLRENSPASNKRSDDLQSLKQTIQQTRSSKTEGSPVCQVVDEQIVPVPAWKAERNCEYCLQQSQHNSSLKQFNVPNSEINMIFSSVRSHRPEILPTPKLRRTSPFRRGKLCCQGAISEKSSNVGKSSKSNVQGNVLTKKDSVTQYNHSTRNTRNLPCTDKLIIRDPTDTEDAYSQAMKESLADKDDDHSKKLQDMRSKVAMTKQSVEKEYRDTITFLNSLPKEKPSKRMTNAYMDEHRQQMQRENQQRRMQQEFKKIEKECRKHSCTRKSHHTPKSPMKTNFNKQDFEYSWLPVPESDASLAIHTVPTKVTESKSGNTVKFSSVDSYHEYRSRHKHTPPTKDTCHEKRDKRIEAVIVHDNSDSIDSNRSSTSESSIEAIALQKSKNPNANNLSDAERIIIYKILDSKNEKKTKKAKLVKDIAKSLSSVDKNKNIEEVVQRTPKKTSKNISDAVPFEELKEGVYKTVNEEGDNIASMYFSDKADGGTNSATPCCCKIGHASQSNKGAVLQWKNAESTESHVTCRCASARKQDKPASEVHPSASTSSFKTATNEKNMAPDEGYIKLVDEGNFYIGASGFLKDEAYEVVIQLRKKDGKEDKVVQSKEGNEISGKIIETQSASIITEANALVSEKVAPVNSNVEVISKEVTKEQDNEVKEQVITESTTELSSSDSNTNLRSGNSKTQNKNDKEVHVASQTSMVCNMVNTDSVPRPATSTYTQTSLSSPNHRPVYFHMSSSTSTAYMSPPDMVLPNFLRQDYRKTDEEIYESLQNSNMRAQGDIDDQYTEDYDVCRCKRCLHARNVNLCSARQRNKMKYQDETSELQTPPNTARSGIKIHENHERHAREVPSNDPIEDKCKCKKCPRKTHSSSIKNYSVKNKKAVMCSKKSSRHITRSNSSIATSYRSKTITSHYNCRKIGLNPVIKSYVDRLLALNKEGLKAVEVAEQDCSSVTTPGSSIINTSRNVNENKKGIEEKISLEQLKNMLKKQILEEIKKENQKIEKHIPNSVGTKTVDHKNIQVPRLPLKKPVHKVKSLNISKHILKPKRSNPKKQTIKNTPSVSSKTSVENHVPKLSLHKIRSKSSPSPRKCNYIKSCNRKAASDMETERNTRDFKTANNTILSKPAQLQEVQRPTQRVSSRLIPTSRAVITDTSTESNFGTKSNKSQNDEQISINTATQTKENTDSDSNLLRVAENKLQNMEKIADLTEKCTLRLSNLAKILEEVRKNKSLIYGHISTSDSASDSDQKSEKNSTNNRASTDLPIYKPNIDAEINLKNKSPIPVTTTDRNVSMCTTDFVPLLTDIPKPIAFTPVTLADQLSPLSSINIDNASVKNRGRPPPALSRIHIKNGQELVVPHELSTVLEVDSPMSVKLKNQSRDKNSEGNNGSHVNGNASHRSNTAEKEDYSDFNDNPDLLQNGSNLKRKPTRLLFSDSSDDSKLQVMDLQQFNNIMLKPFISFKEHAKHCNIVGIDDGSNLDDNPKDDGVNDEISSLHSDGSLPDVIAELLKRNIISEPFKYESGSNVNSTTISSESTLSMLALSKMQKHKRKTESTNKENVVESSDTLSMSSNPDLEKAFKKLGMGWASSTLKKTKERLALSSSSNTSSTSLSQFKLKGFDNYEFPALITDSLSTVLDNSKKPSKSRHAELLKSAEQQTSKTNSMTVKEFLNNELAKKITFTTPSRKDATDEEFVSLVETKMPEQFKNMGHTIQEEGTFDSVPSVKENRARTSTPVQLYKSATYHSSSSSNISNGLFSNADDLSSVKVTSNSVKNHSTSEKDDLAVPNCSLRKKKSLSDSGKSN